MDAAIDGDDDALSSLGGKIRLPSESQPRAIDQDMIVEALGLAEEEAAAAAAIAGEEDAATGAASSSVSLTAASDATSSSAAAVAAAAARQRRRRRRVRGKGEDEASRAFLVKTAQTIRLEFKQILKIENLDCLTSLTRLFLDNNLIERMVGLEQLIHLTWLDLSFNRIQKIEGLDSLKRLEVLALYANQIETVENIHHLAQLKVLRLGRNKIACKENILYLRRLPSLRTLSLKENPYCDSDPEWRGFAVALLPSLSFLECHAVGSEEREAAAAKHQGDVFRAQNQEEQMREEAERSKEQRESQKRLKAAFVASLKGKELLNALLSRKKEEEQQLADCLERWKDHHGGDTEALLAEFSSEMTSIGDEIYALGLRELRAREQETLAFESCVRRAQRAAQERGVDAVDRFLEEKDALFDSLYETVGRLEEKEAEEITELQRAEVDRLREQFAQRVGEVWGQVMGVEVRLVDQTEAVAAEFERNVASMMRRFTEGVSKLFARARYVDTRYFRQLSELCERIEELPFEGGVGSDGKGVESVAVSALVAQCHDAHQALLLAEEKNLQESTLKWREDYLRRFRKHERRRNRDRVLELNHFVDTMRQEEDEMADLLPPPTNATATAFAIMPGDEDVFVQE